MKNRFNYIKNMWSTHKNTLYFPISIIALLFILTALGISGSSIGRIQADILTDGNPDTNLIYGKPRAVRSDEWLVNTQKTLAQEKTDFACTNHNMANGEDVAVLYDIPCRDWSILLKPQNTGYLVLPMNNAFAFHWWFIAAMLLISVYLLALLLIDHKNKHRIPLAILISISFYFSPFIQWWYQYATLAPIYYGVFIIILINYILKSKRISYAKQFLLAYLFASFIIIIYPPFQIPVGLTVLASCIAILLKYKKDNIPLLKMKLIAIFISILLSAISIGFFIHQHSQTIEAVANTAYPGQRIVSSGGADFLELIFSHLNILLQSGSLAEHYNPSGINLVNQSEASGFILLFVLTVPLLVLGLFKNTKKDLTTYIASSLLVVLFIFMIWMYIPNIPVLGTITILDHVPVYRVPIGLGLINIVLLIFAINRIQKKQITPQLGIIVALLTLIFYLIVNMYAKTAMPDYITFSQAIILSLPIPIVVLLILYNRPVYALVVFTIFSLLSTALVNPLYKNVSYLNSHPISTFIQKETNEYNWISDTLQLENLALANGAHTLSGVYLHPQLKTLLNFTNNEFEVNRYAHILFSINNNIDQSKINTKLIQSDLLLIELHSCSPVIKKMNIKYLLSTKKIPQAQCIKSLREFNDQKVPVYIYRFDWQSQ